MDWWIDDSLPVGPLEPLPIFRGNGLRVETSFGSLERSGNYVPNPGSLNSYITLAGIESPAIQYVSSSGIPQQGIPPILRNGDTFTAEFTWSIGD